MLTHTLSWYFSRDEKGSIKAWVLCYVKFKVKVRPDKVTKSKCCTSVVQHMFYGSFETPNLMVILIFKFGRKIQYQVKLGQIRSNF